jgi:hypothetical protein
MSTGNIKKNVSWESSAAGAWVVTTLLPSMSRLSRQCGILNISQPYRLPRPSTGIALLYFTFFSFFSFFTIRHLEREISRSQDLYLRAGKHKKRMHTHTHTRTHTHTHTHTHADNHASNGIRTCIQCFSG